MQLQAAERLYYIYQTLLDTNSALAAAGSEGQQAQQQALHHLEVRWPQWSIELDQTWCHTCEAMALIEA